MNINRLHATCKRFLQSYVLTLLCLAIPLYISAQCPEEIEGFDYIGEYNDHKYYISEIALRWQPASDLANSYGGYLATITSPEENDFIFETVLALNVTSSAHIGLNDYETEGDLVWSNNEAVDFYNVNPTTPNALGINNASMDIWNNGGGWSLKSIWSEQKFILELPCDDLFLDSDVEFISHTCPDEFPTSGNLLNFEITVQNTGNTISSPQIFGFYQSITSNIPISDNLIAQVTVGELAPNETAVISFLNTQMPAPFYFPSFSMNNTQWGPFYVKRFENITGTSLAPDDPNQIFDIYCKKYITDISVEFAISSFEFGDEGLVNYMGEITNNGTATAYNLKVEVGETAFGSIPSINTIPFMPVVTFDDANQTKILCIDELAPGASIEINVFYDFDNAILPNFYDASLLAYSGHLIDSDFSNNSATKTFIYNPNVSDDCPDNMPDFQYLGQYNSNRYFISDAAVHWWEADSIALALGAELTAIETSIENDFLYNYLSENVWIGMSDHEEEGTYVWSNGETISYDNVQGGNGDILDYISLNHWNGIWVVNKAPVLNKFVIEVPCNEVPGSFVDLTASDIVSQPTAAQMDLVPVTFTLTNIGNSDAANEFDVRIYLSADTILDSNDPQVGKLTTGFWGSNYFEVVTLSEGMFVPWNLLLGEYHVIVAVDRTIAGYSSIEESDEINNIIVSEETILITGDPCTIEPSVANGNLTVNGIPEGNSVFILYDAASQIEEMFFCSYDCSEQFEINNLPDGEYSIYFAYFTDNWDLECQSTPLSFSIVLGDLSGKIEIEETEFGNAISNNPLTRFAISSNSIYPNPANDHIITTIESRIDKNAQLEIYDINGRLSISKTIQLHKGIQPIELDIKNLSNGIHNLIIRSNDQILSTQRFVKF